MPALLETTMITAFDRTPASPAENTAPLRDLTAFETGTRPSPPVAWEEDEDDDDEEVLDDEEDLDLGEEDDDFFDDDEDDDDVDGDEEELEDE